MLKAELDVHDSRDAAKPLSSPQERLFLLDQMMPGLGAYNVPTLVRVQRNLDARTRPPGLELIVARHEVLRTRIELSDGVPVQEVMAPARFELRGVRSARAGAAAQRDREASAGSASSSRGPLISAGDVLLRAAPDPHRRRRRTCCSPSFTTSPPTTRRAAILLGELDQAYRALESGASPELPELAIQYADYAVRQRARMSGPRAVRAARLLDRTARGRAAPRWSCPPTDPGRACRAIAARVLEFELPVDPGGGPAAPVASPRRIAVRHPAGGLRHAARALHRGARTSCSGVPVSGRHDEDTQTAAGLLHQHPADAQPTSRAIRRSPSCWAA